jgi:hypothetical protein
MNGLRAFLRVATVSENNIWGSRSPHKSARVDLSGVNGLLAITPSSRIYS